MAGHCALVPSKLELAGLCASGHSPCLSLSAPLMEQIPGSLGSCHPPTSVLHAPSTSTKPCYVDPDARGRSVTGGTPSCSSLPGL